jgi:tRNA-2-methylthio-N6-dimethylallyladenosine synthase
LRTEERQDISQDELIIQNSFMEKVLSVNNREFESIGRKRTYHAVTYGCQMNAHDSEKIVGMLDSMGYELTESEDNADVVIYNTCCIRENAENRMYGNLGYLKNIKAGRKDMKIILCGCMMQQDSVIEKIKKSYNFVDIIFGTYNLYRLPQLLYTNMETGAQVVDVWKEQKEIIEDLPSIRKYQFKAGVNIMYGCNNFCSYCIVPYVRGRERSRSSENIVHEIETLVSDGVKEIMLLGQNVNSYGRGLGEDITFAGLLRKVSKIKGLERIRFMTSHPKDLSDELIEAMAECDNICKYIHLPLQSGSNKVLKAMNRKYTKEDYLLIVEKLRKRIPGIAITTDLIVGFPTETDEDNEETIEVIKKVGYSSAYTFIYSPRSGTAAAKLPMEDEEIIKTRFNKILETLNPISYEINKKHVGKVYKVLAEEVSKNDSGIISGRLDDNSLVHFKGGEELIGNIIDVKINDCKTFYLLGEKI